MCDYAAIFAVVNRELVEQDIEKKLRRRKTSRWPLTQEFIRATECMEKMMEVIKVLKVVSITEMKHKDGVDLPKEEQDILQEPERIRTLFEHFYELSEMERGLVDLREYKVKAEEKPAEGAELQKARTVPGPRKASKRGAAGLKAVYERALPKIFRDEKSPEYTSAKTDA